MVLLGVFWGDCSTCGGARGGVRVWAVGGGVGLGSGRWGEVCGLARRGLVVGRSAVQWGRWSGRCGVRVWAVGGLAFSAFSAWDIQN